jgi:hypothetical protein
MTQSTSNTGRRIHATRLACCAACGLLLMLGACAQGQYRMPYADGTVVDISTDFVTHSTPDAYMFDMVSQNVSQAEVVAAAGGWIRWIEDGNEGFDGNNNYVWIEHPFPFCQNPSDRQRANWPGKPRNYDQTCVPCDRAFCNEWTIYAHFQTGSVTGAANRSQGEWVDAGDFLGFEGNVGFTQGATHLHWFVAVLPPNLAPDANGAYEQYVDATGVRPEVIPIVCHQDGLSVLWRFGVYTAIPCL